MSSDRSDGFSIFADMDPAALRAMFTQIEGAISKGVKAGFDDLGSAAMKAAKSSKMTQASKVVGDAVAGQGKAWSAAKKEVREYDGALSSVTKELLITLKAMQAVTDETKIQSNAVRAHGSVIRQEYITERDMANRQMELEREGLRNIGREKYVAAQKDLVLSRQSGTQRIQITQHVLQTIARLEKSLATAVTGAARTAVSVTKGLFSGLGSILTRHNSDYTKGLSGSLKSREGLLRGSFGRQERDLRASVMRQNAAMAGLRTGTQTGVLGAVSRSGLLGLAGGAGLLMAAKKTFTIGADFTQGLAVLEAQLGLTKEEMAGVRALSIQLGNDLTLPGVSALDAAQAVQILAKQFGSMGPAALGAAEDAAKGTLQLARAANVGAEEAAGVVGAAINVFGIAADQAVMVADQVTAAIAQAAGVSFSDFADSFKQGAAVFAQFQVPAVGATEALVEFDTALAAIARSGLVGSDAGTSLKQFFLQANRSGGDAGIKLKELTERAGETGTAFYDAAGKARPFSVTLDILRKGLVGYTDEQRNSTLQTIFGSDAIRVANALIGISTEEYKKMTDQIRVQGLAAKIAAAQNTGFRGALDALKSVIETVQIVLYEKISPALASFTLGIASAANAVFFGKEAWSLLRRGLLGVAAGMGAVIAMKAASEVIRLLGTSLKLALTPFGAFLVVAGLIGGAIAILTERSPALRKTLGELGDKFKELGGNLREKVQPALDWLSAFINDTLVPAIDRLAAWLARNLIPIFDAVSSFITDTAIPAVKDFVRTLIDLGVKGFDFAVEKAKAFWHGVEPIVQPLIDRFKELKDAVANVFSGDLSGIGKQWGIALAAGLGLGLVNPVLGVVAGLGVLMGPAFVKMLAPVVEKVKTFLSDAFSARNMKKYALGFLALVEEAGRIVGSLVSHPTFIKAIAAIAAAAVVIGAKFVLGFAKGVIDHLDDLWRLLTDALKKGFGAMFDGLGPVLGGLLVAALFGVAVLSLLKRAAVKAGADMGTGLATGLRATTGHIKGVMAGLFKGPTNAIPLFNDLNNMAVKAQDLTNRFRVFGITKDVALNPEAIRIATTEIKKLEDGVSKSVLQGLRLRDTISSWVTAGTGVVSGFSQIAKGLASALVAPFTSADLSARLAAGIKNQLTLGFSSSPAKAAYASAAAEGARSYTQAFASNMAAAKGMITGGWTKMTSAVAQLAKEQGTSVGAIYGQAVAAAAIAAVSALGGYKAGQAEGQGGGSGITSALMGGLTAVAVLAPGIGTAAAAGVGVAVAGAALIGAAMGRSKKAAEDAKAAYEAVADAVKSTFVPALEAGTISVLNLATAMQVEGGRDTIFSILEEGLAGSTLKAIDDAGYSFDSLIAAIRGGDDALDRFIDSLGLSSDVVGGTIEVNIRKTADNIQRSFTEAERIARLKGEEIAAGTAGWAGRVIGWAERIGVKMREGLGGGDGALLNLAGNLKDLQLSPTAGLLDEIGTAANTANSELATMVGNLERILNPGDSNTAAAVDAAVLAIKGEGGLGANLQTTYRTSGADSAEFRTVQRDISAMVGQAIADGFAEGDIVDAASAQAIIAPIKAELLAAVSDPTLRALLEAQFTDPVNAQVEAMIQESQIAATLATLGELVKADPSLERAFAAAGVVGGQAMSDKVTAFIRTHPNVDVSTEWGQKHAISLALGWAQGLADKKAAMVEAARNIAFEARTAIAKEFQVASPSRVMIKIGESVGEGLALGMESMTARVADAAATMAESALLGIGSIQSGELVFNVGLSEADRAALSSITVGLDPADRFIDYSDPEAAYNTDPFEQEQFDTQPDYEPPMMDEPVPDSGADYEYFDSTSESLTELLATATQMMAVIQEIADTSASNTEKVTSLLDVNSKTLAGVEALPGAIAASAEASRLSVDAFVSALGPALARVLTQSVRAA